MQIAVHIIGAGGACGACGASGTDGAGGVLLLVLVVVPGVLLRDPSAGGRRRLPLPS